MVLVRLLALAATALALAVPVCAQTGSLSGTTVDESGAVVPGATVQLVGPQVVPSTTTGPRGDYRFRGVTNGTYRVTVTLAGFSPASATEVTIGNADVVVPPITLTLASLTETVVVSASRTVRALVDAPATMSVVTPQVLASTPALNYGDLLRNLPGVNVIQLSAREVNVTNRSATSTLANSQLVLLDGRSIYLDFFGIVLWDFLPNNLGDIKQIEVIHGPASAVWGANALTGVVNILTKSPREAPGTTVTMNGGFFSRDAGSTAGRGIGTLFGANATVAQAPTERWSYRVSAGYFSSDPLPRPTGQIPIIPDPRNPGATIGGARYPADSDGSIGTAFQNRGTSQPKFVVRADQELDRGRITYEGGLAGSQGIIYTGIGPFNIQPGSYMGYGRVNYSNAGLRVSAFTNFLNVQAPNLLLLSPATASPLRLDVATQTYDVEIGDSFALRRRHLVSVGGNFRRNNFDLSIAPAAEDRNEAGAYAQDEVAFGRVRVTLGGRVDKFGNLSDPAFSPRIAAVFKPRSDHALRMSFNRAFRSPSVINNFLNTGIVVPTDLSSLSPLLPPTLRPLVSQPFPLAVQAVGSDLPIGSTAQQELTKESLTAYEVAYTATFHDRTTASVAVYVNDLHDSIKFTPLPASLDPYTATSPPPGWLLPPTTLSVLAQQGVFLPRTGFTYLNLGPLRQKGVELALDHRISRAATAFINYSWQAKPTVLEDPHPYPLQQLALPPTHRLNVGFNIDGARWLGSGSVNYVDRALWTDVLTSAYSGYSDAFTLVNASLGVKWASGRITTLVKATNILNRDIQQHVFGDLIMRSVNFEVRFTR
jgi:outer membrane receptor protein involved in Fe transport